MLIVCTRLISKSSYKYFIEHERDLITLSLQQEMKQQQQHKKNETKTEKFEYRKWPGQARARNDLHSVIRYSSARSMSAQCGASKVKIFHQSDILISIFRIHSCLSLNWNNLWSHRRLNYAEFIKFFVVRCDDGRLQVLFIFACFVNKLTYSWIWNQID